MAKADYIPLDTAEDVDYEVSSAHPTTAEVGLNSLLDTLNETSSSATVSIHRQQGSGKESLQFLESFAPDKYQPDELLMYIRSTYGGGDYRVHVRENGRLRANKHVSIGEPRIVSRETNAESPALTMMMQQIEKQNRMIAELTTRNAAPQESENDFLNKMLVYKQLFDNGPQKSQGIQDILQTVSSLKELGINVGGIQTDAPQKEEGFGDIVEKMSPVLTALLQQPQQAQQQTPQNYKPNPQPTGNKQNMMNLKLKMGVATLVKAAAKGSPTDFYADFVTDNVSEENIKAFMTDANAMEKLAGVDKRVLEHKEWFEDLGEHLKGALGDSSSKYAADYNLTTESDNVINGETIEQNGANNDEIRTDDNS